MGILRNLKIGEFSIVRGSDKQPANPGAVALFYKAQSTAKEKPVEKEETPAVNKTLAGQVAEAMKKIFGKAVSTRTYVYDSKSTSTETFDDGQAGGSAAAPDASEGSTTIVITDSVAKTEPQPKAPDQKVEKTASKADAVPGATEFTKALEPLVTAVTGLDSRLAKLEEKSVGSQRIKTFPAPGGTGAGGDNGAKFGAFTKFLSDVSRLSPGQRLTKATITSSGWSYGLATTEADAFIDYIVDQSVLLKLIRTIRMPDKTYNIDKIGLGGKVLVKGTSGVDPGDTVSLSGPTQIELKSEEVLAIVSIGDDTVEDNIEGEAFVQHLLGMVARAAANELEQAAIHGDKSVADTGILDRFDGWYKLAKAASAHVTDAMGDPDRYWPGQNGAKATRVLKSIPTQYRQDFRALAWILHNDLYLDYNEELATKGMSEAWMSITGIQDLPLRSLKNIRVPMIKTDMAFTHSAAPYTDGTVVICTDLRNLIFGIHREFKIEPQRFARKRSTDYVISMRCTPQIENGDAIGMYEHAQVKVA